MCWQSEAHENQRQPDLGMEPAPTLNRAERMLREEVFQVIEGTGRLTA